MASKQSKKIILVDAYAILHRAYHALPPLTDNQGRLINAVYGFFTILLKALTDLKPEYLSICFDSPTPTFRHKAFPPYQAQRPEKPELNEQVPILLELLSILKVPFFAYEGFEADDLAGTLALQAQKEKLESVILTGDLDSLQLVGPEIKVYAMRTGVSQAVMYDENEVLAKYQLSPSQMVDFKALIGDPSDNVPGAKNIGPKTASSLLQKYKTLEQIFQNLAQISPSVAENLKLSRKQVFLAQKLVTIDTAVPIKLDLTKAKINNFDFNGLKSKMLSLGLKTLASRLPIKEAKNNQTNLFQ